MSCLRGSSKFIRRVCVVICVITAGVGQQVYAEPLRVVVSELPPCVIAGDELTGYSIELWRNLASEIAREYVLESMDFAAKLNAVQEGRADVAIGCVSISEERERNLDFTHPIALGGFRAASLVEDSVIPNFGDDSLKMLLVLLLFVLFFAHLMWWSEHGQATINDRYFPGVLESVWFSLGTMSTVGYGDITPRKWLGRLSAVLLILTGVTAFGVIFGQFAADAIGSRAQNPVESIADLRKYTVGTKRDTVTSEYLSTLGVNTVHFQNLSESVLALREGELDVIMHDALAISHEIQRNPDLIETGPMFAPHYIGIALQPSSSLREALNRAILKMAADGRSQLIKDRWF